MKSLEALLSQKLAETDPTLDILGLDHKLFEMACQDWRNYLRFGVSWRGRGGKCDFNEENVLRLIAENPVEAEAFMTVWAGMWLRGWRKRVKVLVGEQKVQGIAEVKPGEVTEGPSLSSKCLREMKNAILVSLIRNAEICGTEVLAENILKMELKKASEKEGREAELALSVLSGVLRRVREMAECSRPLIYVKVDKRYYAQIRDCLS